MMTVRDFGRLKTSCPLILVCMLFATPLAFAGSVVSWGIATMDSGKLGSKLRGHQFQDIAAGSRYSLVLKSDGSIACWGVHASAPEGSGFVAIAAGDSHSLALRSNGSIVGWGTNWSGEAPPEGHDFVDIAAGGRHSLALKSDGSIVGWGDSSYGGHKAPRGRDFVAIAAGYSHSLALKSSGSIVGWGSNEYGYDEEWAGQATPPDGNDFVAIAAGDHHSLALRSDGSIVGWGGNEFGQARPPDGNDFVAIAAGWAHSLALKSDGSIVGWGSNEDWRAWVGQATAPDGNDFVAVAAGRFHSLALRSDGSTVGWGANWVGQATPIIGDDFVAVAAGLAHSLALRADGSVCAWLAFQGELPHRDQAISPEGSDFVAIAAGAYHSIALRSDGSILGWGSNHDDKGNWVGQATPPDGNDFVAIAAGRFHSLALKSDGSIVGWGDNSNGQIPPPPDNSAVRRRFPVLPSPNGDFVAIAAGYSHSLALKSDGSVVGWGTITPVGDDFVAIAGGGGYSLALKSDGSIVADWGWWGNESAPTGEDFVAIAAGWGYSLALKSDGSIVGWGWDNQYGQATPPEGNGFTAIAAGYLHSLAIRERPAKYGGGTGEPDDPYQIATAADLIALGETPEDYDKYFVLAADIDFGRRVFNKAVIAPETSFIEGWFERTPFSGVFDGNGHTISNLTCRSVSPMETDAGLFGTVDPNGEVKNLGLIDAQVDATGVFGTGSLVGYSAGTLRNCYAEGGSITGQGGYVGGLIGYNDGRVVGCRSSAGVSGDSYVGGLAGGNYARVIHSYSTGTVAGHGNVGGLVGYNASCITDCYSAGPVDGEGNVGGFLGRTMGSGRSGGSVEVNCFWDTETSGQTQSAGGTGLTTEEMYNPNTFMGFGWDFVGLPDGPHDIWAEPLEYSGPPVLHWQFPASLGLPAFSGGTGEPDDPYLISSPADWNSIGHNPRLMGAHFMLTNDIDLAGAASFVVASQEYPFTGLLDGNGHIVANFSHDAGWQDYLGLFGHVCGQEARIENLGAVDARIKVEGGYGIGVLVGCLKEGIVRGCFVRGGSISGAGIHVGGLAGRNYGIISDCYSDGASVSGRAYVGGLVGLAYAPGTITNCYSSSVVSGDNFFGGLVARAPAQHIAASFWDMQTSGQTVSAGGAGMKTASMQRVGPYLKARWDFADETENGVEDIWWILEGEDYPRLWWELENEALE